MCIYFVLETPNETLVNKSDSMQVIQTKSYPGQTPMGKNKKKDEQNLNTLQSLHAIKKLEEALLQKLHATQV